MTCHCSRLSRSSRSHIQVEAEDVPEAEYFHNKRGLWAVAGLPGCQVVAKSLPTGSHGFSVLDVARSITNSMLQDRRRRRFFSCPLARRELCQPLARRVDANFAIGWMLTGSPNASSALWLARW